MKKPFFERVSDGWERRRPLHLPLWIGFHALILIALLVTGLGKVDTDLYSVLPDTASRPGLEAAGRLVRDRLNSGFYVLIGHPRFERARELAVSAAASLRAVRGLADVELEVDTARLRHLQEFLFTYRYQLLAPDVRAALLSGDRTGLSEKALSRVLSPLSLGGLDRLDLDPFLLSSSALQYYLGSGLPANMSVGLRDGVLSADHDGRSWVLVSGRTAGSGLAVQTDESPIAAVYALTAGLGAEDREAAFAYSGVPFHSYESANKSQAEISILSTISTIYVIVLLLFLFRSVKPLLFTLGAMTLGIGAGMAAAFIAFRGIHIFTIVFGTSLIGISIDYALHYFAVWASPPGERRFGETLRAILPGITLGLLTTLASYVGFLFTAFPLLQQMALFSMVGLISSFLTVVFVFPRLKNPKPRTVRFSNRAGAFLLGLFEKLQHLPRAAKLVAAGLCLAVIVIGLFRLELKNDIRSLYRMGPELKKSEALAAAVLNHGSTGVYLLVEGRDEEETRRREEALLADLEPLKREGRLGSALGATLFVPSGRRQADNYTLAAERLRPMTGAQLELLGFGRPEAAAWEADFVAQRDRRVTQADFEQLPLGSLSKSLWLGPAAGRCYAAVMLFGVKDPSAVKAAVEKADGRYFMNKLAEVNETLQRLSVIAFIIICLSYAVILFGLVPRYGLKRSAQIVLIPALASLIAVAGLSAAGLPWNIFSVIALILIPGMGTDYVIFFTEGKKHPASTVLAITVSMLTTVLSFGILAFTSLADVFGLTVAAGVALSFLLTPLFLGRAQEKKGVDKASRSASFQRTRRPGGKTEKKRG